HALGFASGSAVDEYSGPVGNHGRTVGGSAPRVSGPAQDCTDAVAGSTVRGDDTNVGASTQRGPDEHVASPSRREVLGAEIAQGCGVERKLVGFRTKPGAARVTQIFMEE